ncbi:hypothetical protein [Saccharopolyspora gloriosae]|uniref:hypothetical protein n=1 Tax=Saccharopolyspora gloriosae TaxID=455344 RepID=UPI001FB85335|nr:hypothetical protein [Saccharopolyspora gloriosae]
MSGDVTNSGRALWDRTLGTALPRADGLDLDFCADRFELAGGSIRACAVTAAYLAAEAARPVTKTDLLTAPGRCAPSISSASGRLRTR